MSDRNSTSEIATVNGINYSISVIDHITIEDVVVTEMQLQALVVISGVDDPTRRVSKDIRNLLIKLGVER